MPRCPSAHKFPSVRGRKDPATGAVVQVDVHCEGETGHTGLHWNGHLNNPATPDKTWE